MATKLDLSRKVAMLTGASGGFGVNFAEIVTSHGDKLVLAARRFERLDALVAEIKAEVGDTMAVA